MASDGLGESHMEVMQAELAAAWEHLNGIWQKVGYDEDSLLRRQNTVVKHLKELLEDMCQEAQGKLEDQQAAVKSLMTEIMQLAKDLSIDRVPEIEAAKGKPLLEMQRIFVYAVEELRQRKAVRMEKYETINAMVIEVSSELEEAPMQIEFDGIPPDSQVQKLEHHLGQLYQEKDKRLGQYSKFKTSIIELFNILEKNAENDMELLVTESNEEFDSTHTISSCGIKVLSLQTLRALEAIETSCIKQVEANTQKGTAFWLKIRELWSRLNADEEMMLIFSQVHQSFSTDNWDEIYKPSVLKGLQKELERLEEEKRLNMGLFIKQCREELCNLWLNKCFMTSIQDRFMEPNYNSLTSFSIGDFNNEEYTENLLLKHENEVEFWRGFIEHYKKIIEGVVRRGEMFGQYRILDQKSDDPSRLANRGGALLKEEKERKKLEKAIPKLESELKQLCNEFEQDRDVFCRKTKFLVYGRTIDEMIEQDWEQFHEEKRLRKEAKKKPNEAVGSNKTLMTTQLGNQGTRKRPATPSSAQRATPSKKNKTTMITPGKTISSPFKQPSVAGAPSNSAKRPMTNAARVTKQNNKQENQSMNKNWHFRLNTSSSQTASRKLVRKSIDKLRNRSSLSSNSTSSNSSSSFNQQKTASSQPNLNIGSLEQLNFSKVIRGQGPAVEAIKEKAPKKFTNKENVVQSSVYGMRSMRTPSKPPQSLIRQPSAGKIAIPCKLTGKEEELPSSSNKNLKDSLLSPITTYSEFTDHLLCQSTLNSSAVVPVQKQVPSASGSTVPTTPTKSGMALAPAKMPLRDNCF